MKTATTYIAESMVKAVGVAGIEAMAMKNAIYSIWKPRAEVFYDDIIEECFSFADDDIRPEYADFVLTRHRNNMTEDFIEEALPYVEEYVGYAWDRGREDAFGVILSGLLPLQKGEISGVHYYDRPEYAEPFPNYYYGYGQTSSRIADRVWERYESYDLHKFQKDQESIISELVTLTGSTKANVQRTIKRWFRTTQGQYFDRFIVPETARLLSYEEGASLRSIGIRYKEFVQGEGYWSSVSEFNTESSKVFSQVQALHEMNVTTYTIEAIIDEKTCDVCMFLNGSTWSVEEAVTKMYDLLISEADSAGEINPFPPRSTPKDFEDPQESPYNLPPYHPRCRCSVRSTSQVTAMPQEVLARPFDAGPRPTDKLLNKVFAQYMTRAKDSDLNAIVGSYVRGGLGDSNVVELGLVRQLTNAEWKVAKEAWESMPFEVKKWASRNTDNFNLYIRTGDDITSRVIGNSIEMNAKYFDTAKYGPQPLQHELRHALVNKSVINARGGGDTIWREMSEAAEDINQGWRPPAHVNAMYQINGNRGLQAANAASDEFLAMIGDHYRPDMPMTELIKSVRHKKYGIDVSDKIGSTLVSTNSRWSAREAKNAVEYWWYAMDIDNNTLLSKKQMLSKLTFKPTDKQVYATAMRNEVAVRDTLRAAGVKEVYQEGDNAPFDVWVGANPAKYYSGASRKKPIGLIEVKTIIKSDNNKITMRKAALARKKSEFEKLKKKGTAMHTIVFDERDGKIYYREGIGSFRLSKMEEVTPDDLAIKFGGKPTIRELPAQDYAEFGGTPPEYRVTYKKQTSVAKATAEIKKKFDVEVAFGMSNDAKKMPYSAKVKTQILNQVGEELERLNNEQGVYVQWALAGRKKGTVKPTLDRLVIANGNDIDGVKVKFKQDLGYGKLFDQEGRGTTGTYLDDRYFGENTILISGTDVRRWRTDRVKNLNDVFLTRADDLKFGDIGVGLDTMTTLDHEIGHGVHYYLEVNDQKTFNEWARIFNNHSNTEWKRGLSVYAATDEYEAFAESFAAFVHPDYGMDTALFGDVEDFFTKILGIQIGDFA